MGIFDFLKKKASKDDSVNALETLLKSAASDTSVRGDFYRKLLSEELFVLSDKTRSSEGRQLMERGALIGILSFNDGRIPVFTSTERIFDKGIINEQVNYIAIKGEDLFNLTKGATFLLNPYSDYGKELIPNEIENLLSGNIFHNHTRSFVVDKDTRVLIGSPAKYPTEIVNALIQLFESERSVEAAYLAFIQLPEKNEPAHYAFCIDTNGEDKSINDKAGRLVQQYLKSGEFVDFVSKESLGWYFDTVEPFYKR